MSDARVTKSDGSYATYSGAFDAAQQYGCKCDDGYRGADCSNVECPSEIDPFGGDGGDAGRDCSGRGICDYSSGLCTCFTGYAGEACSMLSGYA